MKGYIKPYCKHNGYCYDDCHLLCAVFKCRTEAAKQQKDKLKSRQKRTVMQSKITTGKHIQHISLSLTLLISFYRLALTPFLFCLTQPLICFSTLLLRLSPSAAPVVSLLYWISSSPLLLLHLSCVSPLSDRHRDYFSSSATQGLSLHKVRYFKSDRLAPPE